jgi:mono/diheme cytochrome c family protein
MNKTTLWFLIIPALLLSSPRVQAETDRNDPDVIAEGGRLYDKWWEEYDLREPTSTHPSYTASGKKKGATTWRCKECHGWDYQGEAGAYAKGSHFTGIQGIRLSAGRNIDRIVTTLKNSTHQYDKVMLDYGLQRLAIFVANGQLDMDKYIDRSSKQARGDADNGAPIYRKWCRKCHGRDGRVINFKDDNGPEYIGTVAQRNPWEALHKLRNGQPGRFVMGGGMPHMMGGGMPHMMGGGMPHMNDKLSIQEQIDLLTYLQTLPVK